MQIGVDIGGTFTDIVALDERGRLLLTKVPTTPKDFLEGVAVAVRRVLAQAGASAATVERFIHGTTVATNAVLEQKGAVTAMLTTEGFEDVLELGRQKRSRMYDLDMDPRRRPSWRPGAVASASASGWTRAAPCSCRSTRNR